MGLLAENKSRSRINKDPNNTKWTRDTTTFGQRMLRAQGWQPGQFLGAQDTAHSELLSAANASYIRVALKHNMKGLGFDKAKENQVTGLDVFSDLLSRLNGRSEECIEGDRLARLEMKTHRYVEARWGPMRFVRGGLFVGDEMKEVTASTTSSGSSSSPEVEARKGDEEKRGRSEGGKKRKAADGEDGEGADAGEDAARKEKKRRRKEERRANKLAVEAGEDGGRSRKKAKREKSKSRMGRDSEAEEEQVERREGGEKKKKKKKKRRKEEGGVEAEPTTTTTTTTTTTCSSAGVTGTSTPTATGSLTPGSRNFVRSRFIAQKRQAVLDTKALAQIFMVKT